MLWRGIRRRCAWCGGRGAFFTGWFAKQDRCRTCGIGWQRGYEGFELGALAISAILVLGTLVAAMTVGIVLTLPGVDVLPLLLILGAGAVVLPIAALPDELHAVAGRGPGDAPARAGGRGAAGPSLIRRAGTAREALNERLFVGYTHVIRDLERLPITAWLGAIFAVTPPVYGRLIDVPRPTTSGLDPVPERQTT